MSLEREMLVERKAYLAATDSLTPDEVTELGQITATLDASPVTAWGDPLPEGCVGEPTEHQGYSDYDGECRDCGYGSGVPTCDSCQ